MNKCWQFYQIRPVYTQKSCIIVQIFPKKAKFGQIASSPRLFTPTCKYFYTNIFVIFVTFRNSVLTPFKWSPSSSTGLFSANISFTSSLCENLFCLCCAILPLTFRCFNVSTGKVCSDKGKTRSVEKIEFQCQGALQRPVHAGWMRGCVRALKLS